MNGLSPNATKNNSPDTTEDVSPDKMTDVSWDTTKDVSPDTTKDVSRLRLNAYSLRNFHVVFEYENLKTKRYALEWMVYGGV